MPSDPRDRRDLTPATRRLLADLDAPAAGRIGEHRLTRRTVIARTAVLTGALAIAPAARAAHQWRPWPADKRTPAFALDDLDAHRWTLDSLRGKPLVLNFWASWCPPCRDEMPSLELLQTRHERTGLVVLAVNFQETVPTIRRFLEVLPFSLPILPDPKGEATLAWTPRVFPSTVLIDRQGRPRGTVVGELDWMGSEAAALIDPLLR